jgi:cytochrome c556
MKSAAIFPFVILATLAIGAAPALAKQNPIIARQHLMKANGRAAKQAAAMAKGEAPFDLSTAKKVFATFENAAQKMPNLFPPDSKTGHKTKASPKIWQNMADVKARFAKLGSDAKAAAASVTDLASFRTAFVAIGRHDCGSCHHEYRIRKK